MSFPSTQVVLDDFGRADGAPGANWSGPALGFPGNNTITGRKMAAGNVSGSSSAWATPMGSLLVSYVQVTTLPPQTGGLGVQLDFASNLSAATGNMGCILQWDDVAHWELSTTTRSGGGIANQTLAHFNSGDWFAARFDPSTLTIAGWYYDSQLNSGWTSILSASASDAFVGPKMTQGWQAILTFNDGGTCKVGAFGAEALPGSTPTLTAPVVHGKGAC